MKGTHLGEFEELVLLVVGVLYDQAYGIAIQDAIKSKCKRSVSLSTVHSTLHRLEKKGFLISRYDGATPKRGGRRKHLFRVSVAGERALVKSRNQRNELWQSIPNMALGHTPS
ncbi:MAG: PadR family transcriptional regulator [Bacteroidota bacterium]